MKPSVTIIGGGMIGLSIAYELLNREWNVTLIDRHEFGKEASWAGAGILLPANRLTTHHPLEHLSDLSNRLHQDWSQRLKTETGIDNGFHRCGGLYIARTLGEVASLSGLEFQWQEEEIQFESLSKNQLSGASWLQETNGFADVKKASYVVNESQVCNPLHLKALIKFCQERGARLLPSTEVLDIQTDDTNNITCLQTSGGPIESEQVIFCGGAWTEQILQGVANLPMTPVRGQMILYKLPKQIFEPILYEGSHYLVPRKDGHVLAGATVEEVGFDKSTTDEAMNLLMSFASRQFPQLNSQTCVKSWAGLRPTTFDGFPYIGKLFPLENAFVATGHFRLGIQLSTGTAHIIGDLLESKNLSVDISAFSPTRNY